MKNLFAYIDNEILTNMNELQNIIFRLIPLKSYNGNIKLFENINQIEKLDNWESLFEFSIDSDKNILEQVSAIVLDLCNPYLYFHKNLPPKNLIQELFSPHKNTTMEELWYSFETNIVNSPTYMDELKNIMILSYSYIRTMNKKRISNESNIITDYIFNKNNNKNGISPRALNDKISILKKNNNGQIILPQFLSNFSQNNNNLLDIRSYLDIEVIVGLLNSRSKTKNPFIGKTNLDNESRRYDFHFNLDGFLRNFSGITLNKTQKPSVFLDSKNTITFHHLIAHNQFCLERFTNINFINTLYDLYEQQHISPILSNALREYMSLPLVNTRLNILKFHHNLINDVANTILPYDFYEKWASRLRHFFLEQLFCTIPIVLIVFQYLMMLLEKNESFMNKISIDMDTYFKKSYTNDDFQFFHYDDDVLSPTKRFPAIPAIKFGEFSLPLYDIFNTQSCYYAINYSFFDHLVYTFGDNYPQWLAASLSNVSPP